MGKPLTGMSKLKQIKTFSNVPITVEIEVNRWLEKNKNQVSIQGHLQSSAINALGDITIQITIFYTKLV